MDQQQLAAVLQRQGIDSYSLAPLMSAGHATVYRVSTSGAAAVALWQALRTAVDDTGYWPILLGGDEDLEEYEDGSREVWEEAKNNDIWLATSRLPLWRPRHLPMREKRDRQGC